MRRKQIALLYLSISCLGANGTALTIWQTALPLDRSVYHQPPPLNEWRKSHAGRAVMGSLVLDLMHCHFPALLCSRNLNNFEFPVVRVPYLLRSDSFFIASFASFFLHLYHSVNELFGTTSTRENFCADSCSCNYIFAFPLHLFSAVQRPQSPMIFLFLHIQESPWSMHSELFTLHLI